MKSIIKFSNEVYNMADITAIELHLDLLSNEY